MNKAFEIGKTYRMRSPCNYDCVWSFTVAKRTAKTVTLVGSDGKVKRCGVRVYSGEESCTPLGRYSMCPVLRAA